MGRAEHGAVTGVGACGIVLAAELSAGCAATSVASALAAAHELGGLLLVLDTTMHHAVATTYPAHRETRLSVTGPLDATTGPLLAGTLAALLNRRPAVLIVDLRRATTIDAHAAAILARAAGRIGRDGGTLAILRPPERVRRVLRGCGLEDLLAPLRDAPVFLG